MKKIMMVVVVFGILVAGLWLMNDALDTAYADKCIAGAEGVRCVECVVVASDETILTLEDSEYNYWEIEDSRYNKGDVVIAWIDDNGTANDVVDDVIVDTCRGIAD